MPHLDPLRRIGGRGRLRLPAGLRIAVGHVLYGKVLLIGAVVAHLGTGDDLRRPQRCVVRHAEGDQYILEDWRKLTTSDHLYYMCTKYWADGDVHKYFSPYDSPYDAYINFMNVLDNLRQRAGE